MKQREDESGVQGGGGEGGEEDSWNEKKDRLDENSRSSDVSH